MPREDDYFDDDNDSPVTRGDVRLILRNLEVKMWKIGAKITVVALAGNQALNHVQLPPAVGFTAAIVAGVAFIGKSLFIR